MTTNLVRNWHNGREIRNRPSPRRKAGEVNHATRHRQQESVHPLEIAHDAVQAYAEARGLEFLGRCGPFHVDAASVADECFAHVEGEAAEEEDELGGFSVSLLCGEVPGAWVDLPWVSI